MNRSCSHCSLLTRRPLAAANEGIQRIYCINYQVGRGPKGQPTASSREFRRQVRRSEHAGRRCARWLRHPVRHPHVLSLSRPACHPHPAASVLDKEGPAHLAATRGRNTCLEGKHQEKEFKAMGKRSQMAIFFQK